MPLFLDVKVGNVFWLKNAILALFNSFFASISFFNLLHFFYRKCVGEGKKLYHLSTLQYFGKAIFESIFFKPYYARRETFKTRSILSTYLGFKNGMFAFKLGSGSNVFNEMD